MSKKTRNQDTNFEAPLRRFSLKVCRDDRGDANRRPGGRQCFWVQTMCDNYASSGASRPLNAAGGGRGAKLSTAAGKRHPLARDSSTEWRRE